MHIARFARRGRIRPLRITVTELLREEFESYAAGRRLRLEEHKAARSIMSCRTPALGGFEYRCPERHETWQGYHSCHHRSCPQCNGQAKQAWLARTRKRLLPIDHYHVIMTLPHELNDLWRHNRVWFSRQLFANAAGSLKQLLGDPRHLGALPGLMLCEHTWGRNLAFHPHVHCLVTAGGIDPEGQWRTSSGEYLMPGRALAALYRGKWLAALYRALDAHQLSLPPRCTDAQTRQLLRRLAQKAWHVRIQKRYRHGRGVVGYLARYVRGGPIRNRSLTVLSGDKVRFAYYDHKQRHHRVLILTKTHFLGRLLSHVPPTYRQRVRYYGLYHAHRRQHRQWLRRQLNAPSPAKSDPSINTPRCTRCHRPYCVRHWRWHGNYIIKRDPARYVQQRALKRHAPAAADGVTTATGPPRSSFFCRRDMSLN